MADTRSSVGAWQADFLSTEFLQNSSCNPGSDMRRISTDIGNEGLAHRFLPSRDTAESNPNRPEYCIPRNDIPRKTRLNALCGSSLPSQSGLCLRELVGASRRVRRGTSLGDSTSEGAEHSQFTLHADHANLDDGILSFLRSEKAVYPVFSLLPGIKHRF